jgi:hypothetical protein
MFSTATDLGAAGKDTQYGWGVVNASAAVTKATQSSASDSIAPVVKITTPTTSAKMTGLAPVNVTATDNIAVVRVELYVNGTLYATDTVTPFDFILDTSGFADGSATLVSKGYDAAGNAGSSASVAVTIANDTIASGSTVTGTVSVTASAIDNNKVAEISLAIDGKQVALSYGSSLSYSWNTGSTSTNAKGKGRKSTATAVSHSLVVTAKDPAGNVTQQSSTVTAN